MSEQKKLKKEMTPEEIKIAEEKKAAAKAKKDEKAEKEKRLAEIKYKKLKDMTSEELALYYGMKEIEARKKKNSSMKKAMDDRLKAENDSNKKFVEKYKPIVKFYEEFIEWSEENTINHKKSDGTSMKISIHDWFLIERHPEKISEEILNEYNS